MFVRDLGIYAGTQAKFPKGLDAREFHRSTAHILEILISLIPYRKINFGDLKKINVMLGENPREEYEQSYDGIATFSDKSFDFFEHFELSDSERERIVLKRFKLGLLKIGEIVSANPSEMIELANRVEEAGFRRKFYPEKLAKWTKSRNYRFHVFVDIHPYYENWGVDVKDRDGEIVKSINLYKNNFFGISGAAMKQTRWSGEVFQIINRNNRVIHEISAADIGFL